MALYIARIKVGSPNKLGAAGVTGICSFLYMLARTVTRLQVYSLWLCQMGSIGIYLLNGVVNSPWQGRCPILLGKRHFASRRRQVFDNLLLRVDLSWCWSIRNVVIRVIVVTPAPSICSIINLICICGWSRNWTKDLFGIRSVKHFVCELFWVERPRHVQEPYLSSTTLFIYRFPVPWLAI